MKKKILMMLSLIALLVGSASANAALWTVADNDLTFLLDIVDGIDKATIYAALAGIFTLMAGIRVFTMSAHTVLSALGRK